MMQWKTREIEQRAKVREIMNRKNGSWRKELQHQRLKKLKLGQLVSMLLETYNVDDALPIENAIISSPKSSNLEEIERLLSSERRYFVLAGLRILSESTGFQLSAIYDAIDKQFDKTDLIIKRLCIDLISNKNLGYPKSNHRMAQFLDFPDEPIRRSIRRWLLWCESRELLEFSSDFDAMLGASRTTVDLVLAFKGKCVTQEEFFYYLALLDHTGFEEFSRLSRSKYGLASRVFTR